MSAVSGIPDSHADLLDKPVIWHVATDGPVVSRSRRPYEPIGMARKCLGEDIYPWYQPGDESEMALI